MRFKHLAPIGVVLFFCLNSIAQNLPATRPTGGIRIARGTGHRTNYDEDKVGNYTLPDPLVMANGQPVRDAATWYKFRRPEILALYQELIYGRVPDSAPNVTFEVVSSQTVMNGLAIRKKIVGHIGDKGQTMTITLTLPANASGPVPVILALNFDFSQFRPAAVAGAAPSTRPARVFADTTPIAQMIALGYGYAWLYYTDIQPDRAGSFTSGVQALAMGPGQTTLKPDDWSTITCWAWGLSRVMDYFETDPAVDAHRVAIVGHSRLGKTVLWAGALDQRIALVFSSCAGEMGSSLARRDFGETIDDIAQNYYWQFAGNFQRYIGHWNEMPVDTHMLISLIAPRPCLITGGSLDQWSDPRGECLAEIAAGPVYRLLGARDLGTTEVPPLETPLITGDLAFHYHNGAHLITASDWKVFFAFAGRYLKPVAPVGR
jgi:hypothetical protein